VPHAENNLGYISPAIKYILPLSNFSELKLKNEASLYSIYSLKQGLRSDLNELQPGLSLLCFSDKGKKFYIRGTKSSKQDSPNGANVIKHFTTAVTDFRNKLVCSSLRHFPSLVQCFLVRLEPTRMKHRCST